MKLICILLLENTHFSMLDIEFAMMRLKTPACNFGPIPAPYPTVFSLTLLSLSSQFPTSITVLTYKFVSKIHLYLVCRTPNLEPKSQFSANPLIKLTPPKRNNSLLRKLSEVRIWILRFR